MIKPANGTTGHLLKSMDGAYRFRVYDEDGMKFTDYDLHHYDLTVTICDEDSAFYITDETSVLDHSPETLGNLIYT